MSGERPRVLWLAGTRNEVMHLAPYFRAFAGDHDGEGRIDWFAVTGEQGIALYQAMDEFDVRADEEAELRHPAEDPAARLQGLLGSIETVARRRRATHLVFSGTGPTAAAAALVCHGRSSRGIWMKPADPVGLIPRLHWERGLAYVIGALGDSVNVVNPGFPPVIDSGQPAVQDDDADLPKGRRPEAPLVILAVTRAAWGSDDAPERIVAAAARFARESPEVDWLFLRSLDARFEGPLNAVENRPENLLTAPPVPYAVYGNWVGEAQALLTDSCTLAAEGLASGARVAALGELPQGRPDQNDRLMSITPGEIGSPDVRRFLAEAVSNRLKPAAGTGFWGRETAMFERLQALTSTV